MELPEKLEPLRLGNLRIVRRLAKRSVGVEALHRQHRVVRRLAHLDHAAEFARLAKRCLPTVVKRIVFGHLLEIVRRALGGFLRLDEYVDRLSGEVIGQASGLVFWVGSELLFEDAQLSAGGEGDPIDFISGQLRLRIERPQRLDFVSKKLEAHRPRAGQWKDVEDAAAQGDLPLLANLRLRFVALVLEPFDQVEWVDPVAQYETAEPLFQLVRSEGALQQADAVGHDDRADAIGVLALGQVNERLQPLAQYIGVRQF